MKKLDILKSKRNKLIIAALAAGMAFGGVTIANNKKEEENTNIESTFEDSEYYREYTYNVYNKKTDSNNRISWEYDKTITTDDLLPTYQDDKFYDFVKFEDKLNDSEDKSNENKKGLR